MKNRYQGERICNHEEKKLKEFRQVYYFFLALLINYFALHIGFNWCVIHPALQLFYGGIGIIISSAILYYLFNLGTREYYLDEEGFTVRHILLFHQRFSWTQVKGMRSVYFVIDKKKPPQHWIVWSIRPFPSSKRFSNYWVSHRQFSCFFVEYTDQAYELLNRYYGVDKTTGAG